jgi:hypothetical protein
MLENANLRLLKNLNACLIKCYNINLQGQKFTNLFLL